MTKPPPGTPPLDPLLLAAWLDGRLDETAAANVDALLAADDGLLDAMLAAKLAAKVPDLPTAASLAAFEAASRQRFAERPPARPVLPRMALAATVLLGITLGGLGLGREAAMLPNASLAVAADSVLGGVLVPEARP